MQKRAIVCGAGGFIGGHLVKRLKREGFWVRGVDLKFHEHAETEADDFVIGDLRDQDFCRVDRRYAASTRSTSSPPTWAAPAIIFTGEHDADIMHNSATINLNMLDACLQAQHQERSSIPPRPACIRPTTRTDPDNPNCSEESAYPAAPDSEYGWEKLFSERLYLAYSRNYGMQNRVARYHNIFGPEGTWDGGREKAPAAICRKVAEDASRRRDRDLGRRQADAIVPLHRRMRRGHDRGCCVRGFRRARSISAPRRWSPSTSWPTWSATSPARRVEKQHIPGPLGVRGRNSDNRLIREKLGWAPSQSLRKGLEITYQWIEQRALGNSAAVRVKA